jgi:hypothetical protein
MKRESCTHMRIKSDVYSPEHDKYYRNLWVCLFSRFLEAARPQVTYGPASAIQFVGVNYYVHSPTQYV